MASPTLSGDPAAPPLPGRWYRVGGSVRDELLGETAGDRDWVVVGATPQAMLDAGFVPVGRDFPVFLHPQTHEEVALARTERKTAPGYRGFVVHASPEVTLEEDLARRDLTINAMARDADGTLIDPCGGASDLAHGVLRHVGPAFVEDPVRLLRVARFAARWPGFRVAEETLQLMRQMVGAGEVDALVPERVWQELARGLMERAPQRMLQVLQDCGAAARLLPGLRLDDALQASLQRCASEGAALAVRFACLSARVPALSRSLHVPGDVLDLARLLQRENDLLGLSDLTAEVRLALFERCDAWRRPQRLRLLIDAARCLADAPAGWPPSQAWLGALERAGQIDASAVAAQAAREGLAGPDIGQRVRQARLEALAAA